MARETEYPVKSVRTDFLILEALQSLGGARVTELARYLNLPKSSVYDHLKTLRNCGYVEKRGTTYVLDLGFVPLGASAQRESRIYRAASDEVTTIADETDAYATLTVAIGKRAVLLMSVNRCEELTPDGDVGAEISLKHSAPGRAILASLPHRRVKEILTDSNEPDVWEGGESHSLSAELRTIRRRGYATDTPNSNVRRVAVPITDPRDHATSVLSLTAPSESPEREITRLQRRNSIGSPQPAPGAQGDVMATERRYTLGNRGSIDASSQPGGTEGSTSSDLVTRVKETVANIESNLAEEE
ncbi:IclR family transcriptional regulator [Halegenticoccus soli]|uniref:IclR family transcriptional regulator n=1 Tax=Halegenticoccus soli TaxID=1985678 RepID=UPI000C6DC82F|nr:helix-turn-helix domain-containing protein [Halegenticoccus soli]